MNAGGLIITCIKPHLQVAVIGVVNNKARGPDLLLNAQNVLRNKKKTKKKLVGFASE